MPVVSAGDLTTIRSKRQWGKLGLLVFRPEIIATGQSAVATGSRSFSLGSYSATETPQQYYTVIAGSSAGNDDGGKTRLKSITGGGAMEVAPNNIDWTTYPYVSILREILPWSILPDLGNDLMDWDIPYNGNQTSFPPIARIGPPPFAMVGETVKFFSDSEAITGSISSHSWTFPGGSPSSSSSAGTEGSPIEVTFATATGHVPKYVKYTVTASNGKSHTRYNPIWILDEFDDAYCQLEIDSCSGSESGGGWDAKFTVHGDATTSEFPQDCMVMVIAEDYYDDNKTSVGGNWAYRENVVYIGWITNGTVFKNADTGSVSFETKGPIPIAKDLLSWPANLEYKSSPSQWNHIAGMTCDRAALHIVKERSTLDHIVDINLTGNTKLLRYVDIPETDLSTQLDDYCLSAIGARAISDRQGQIYFSRDPNKRPLGERSSIPTTMDIELADIRSDPGANYEEEIQYPRVAQVDFIGFNYDGNDASPLYSLAPQYQFEHGKVEKVDGVLCDDQTEANVLSGMYLADFNNLWTNIKFPMWNMRVFDIVPEEYATHSLVATDTKRGIVWDSQKLICREASVEYDPETYELYYNVTFEKDSFGPPGVGGGYYTPSAVPSSVPDPPGEALAAWGSWYIRKKGDNAWTDRSTQDDDSFIHGCVDPWWFVPTKANSLNPDKSWIYGVGAGGIFKRSLNGGQSWSDVTVDAPPNTWSDATAPTATNIDLVWVIGDIYQINRFYVLGRYQGDGDAYRGWVGITDDNFNNTTWYALYDGVTLVDEVRPLGAAVNETNLLITTWEDDGVNTEIRMQVWSPSEKTYQGDWVLGAASTGDIPATLTAYPFTVIDANETWYVYGRMSSPTTLSGTQHVIKYADGTWTSVESTWGSSVCNTFHASKADDQGRRNLYAVRS